MHRRILPILLLWALAGACLPAFGGEPAARHHHTARHVETSHAETSHERSRKVASTEGSHHRANVRSVRARHSETARPVRVSEVSFRVPRRSKSRKASERRRERSSATRLKSQPVVWARSKSAEHLRSHAGEGAPEEAAVAASGADQTDAADTRAANDAAVDEPVVRHNSKIHYRQHEPAAAAEARNPGDAQHDGKSAAFVSSVLAQQKTTPSATPALAAGAADEVADQSEISDEPADAGKAQLEGNRQQRSATAYVSSRSMPAGALSAPTGERPHVPSVEEEVLTPTILPAIHPVLYNRRGRLIVPPAMKGTHAILVHQNTMADSEGLTRIQDDADLLRMRSDHRLVPLPMSAGLRVDDRLPTNRRYTRPWTEVFLATLANAHYARFHTPLQVNSAVRTVEFQERLMRTNGNAAPAEGLTASPHLTGQAVDLAKHGLSMTEIAWLRGYLMPLVQEGKIDVEEEFQQSCFHISVYESYLPRRAPRRMIADKHHNRTAVLASAIQ